MLNRPETATLLENDSDRGRHGRRRAEGDIWGHRAGDIWGHRAGNTASPGSCRGGAEISTQTSQAKARKKENRHIQPDPVGTHSKPTRLPSLPGPQLVFTAPGELPEALVVLVVVVEHSVQAGGAQVQQGVVGCLLLLATGVAIEEVVDLVGNFWAGGQGLVSGVQEMSTKNKAHQDNAWLWWNHEAHLPQPLLEPRFVPRGMINVVSRHWRNNREDGITRTQLD